MSCVLVPFVAAARAGAARLRAPSARWMPRIETTRTLAASLGPPPRAADGESSASTPRSTRLSRRSCWRRKPGAPTGCAATRAASSRAAARVVDDGAASWRAPRRRRAATLATGWWQRARATLFEARGGPGGLEKHARADRASSGPRRARRRVDRSPVRRFGPSAWIAIQAGGADRARRGAARARATRRRCVVDTDVAARRSRSRRSCATRRRTAGACALRRLRGRGQRPRPRRCSTHLGRGERPVALDRAGPRAGAPRARAARARRRAHARRDRLEAVDHARRRERDGAARRRLVRPPAPTPSSTGSSPCRSTATPEAGSLASLEAICRRAARSSRRDAARLDALPRRGTPARGSDGHARRDRRGHRDVTCRPGSMPCTTRSSAGACSRGCATTTPAARRSPRSASTRRSRPRVARRSADGVEPLTLAEFTRWVDDVLERVAYRPPTAAAADEATASRHARPTSSSRRWRARCCVRSPPSSCPAPTIARSGAMPVDDSLLPRSAARRAFAADVGGSPRRRAARLRPGACACRA